MRPRNVEAATPLRQPRVHVLMGRVIVENVVVDDPSTAAFLTIDPVLPITQLEVRAADLRTWLGARATLVAAVQNTGTRPITITGASAAAPFGITIAPTSPLPAQPIAPGEVRTLPEGRTDTLVQAANVEAATAQIQVTLTDARGKAFVRFAVDVRHAFSEDNEWSEGHLVGCAYPGEGEVFVRNGHAYVPARNMLGKEAKRRTDVCTPTTLASAQVARSS